VGAMERLLGLDVVLRDEHWSTLPSWFRFLVLLGGRLAEGAPTSRNRIAVVLPTADFAVGLLAGGLIAETADSSTGAEHGDHVRKLRAALIGSPVNYRRDGRLLKGLWQGSRLVADGSLLLGVQLEADGSGGLTRWIREGDARKLELSQVAHDLPMTQAGQRVKDERFSESVMGSLMLAGSGEHCVVIGRRETVRQHLRTLSLRHRRERGTLNDLVRIRDFGPPAPHFAHWQSARSTRKERPAGAVVFADALSFLWGRARWMDRSWLVVLDRRDTSIQDAVNAVEQLFVESKSEVVEWSGDALLPGVELFFFTEAV